jgi:transcriptional regulator GlxA family with amidase domain
MNAVWEDCADFQLRPFARRLGVSPRHLGRTFVNATGMSVGVYLNAIRVRHRRTHPPECLPQAPD